MRHKLLLLTLLGLTLSCTKTKDSENKQTENSHSNNNKTELNVSSSKEHFPPVGWKIIGTCSTDFNKDNIIDKAYVIQEEKETISKEDYCHDEPFHQKELIITFGQADGTTKTILKTSKIFGKCNWGIQSTDAFDGIDKRKNTLKLSFTTGGTLRSSLAYYFRFQDNDWYLIGYDEMTYQIPSEDKYIKEINYLTGKKNTYEIINGITSENEVSDIGKSELLKLSELDASEHNTAGEE